MLAINENIIIPAREMALCLIAYMQPVKKDNMDIISKQ